MTFRPNTPKKFVAAVVVLAAFARAASAASYSEQVQALEKTAKPAEVQKFIQDSAAANESDPDYYIASANYWYHLSQQVSITTKAAQGKDFVVADQKTGKAVGSISTAGSVNPQLLSNASGLLQEGSKRFPDRLDIGVGLAYMLRAQRKYDECLGALKQILETASARPREIRWKNGSLPRVPWNEFLPESLQDYSSTFYKLNSKQGDKLSQELCEAIIKAYPDHPYAYNILAALSSAHGDEKACIKYLQTALEKAPGDTLVMFNLGDTYKKAGDKASAKRYYELILSSNPPADMKPEVEKALRDLAGANGN